MEHRALIIQKNIQNIKDRIAEAAKRSGRKAKEITLLAVTKNVASDDIRAAIQSGIRNIGENKVQEAKLKFKELGPTITWHFIGHLQTNKARTATAIFDIIESVDSERVADQLDQEARRLDRQLKVLVEVNIGQEEQKFGIEPARTKALVEYVALKPHLQLRGLMAMVPFVQDPEQTRPFFRSMSHLFNFLKNSQDEHWQVLSMGMTHDFEVAIEEGSNEVRIGTGIFHTSELRRPV